MKKQPTRIEYRYDAAHPAYVELQREADLRGVNLQQHINDLLIGRHLARSGQTPLHELLWLPGVPAPAAQEQAPPLASGARELAEEWL